MGDTGGKRGRGESPDTAARYDAEESSSSGRGDWGGMRRQGTQGTQGAAQGQRTPWPGRAEGSPPTKRTLCVVCCTPMAEGRHSMWCRASAVHGCPGDALPLCLMVQLKFSLGLGLCASVAWLGCVEAGSWAAEILQYTATL